MGFARRTKRKTKGWLATIVGLVLAVGILAMLGLGGLTALRLAGVL